MVKAIYTPNNFLEHPVKGSSRLLATLTKIEERLAKIEMNEREIAAKIERNEQTFLDFLNGYQENRGNDLMAIADHNERLDYYSNLARQSCVLITGLKLRLYIEKMEGIICSFR